MSEKFEKIIKDIRLEIAEAVVADKEDFDVRANACLLHVKYLVERYLQKG